MNYTEFVQKYVKALEGTNLRDGQLLFHSLEIERPDLAEQIRGTAIDPFYDDDVMTKTWSFLAVSW